MSTHMRAVLKKLAQPVTPVETMSPQKAMAAAATMSKLTSSAEFQKFVATKIKELRKPASALTAEEYNAIVGEFITPVARMFTGN